MHILSYSVEYTIHWIQNPACGLKISYHDTTQGEGTEENLG